MLSSSDDAAKERLKTIRRNQAEKTARKRKLDDLNVSSNAIFTDAFKIPQHDMNDPEVDPKEPSPKKSRSIERKRHYPRAPPTTKPRRRQAALKRQPNQAASSDFNMAQAPAPQRPQSVMVEYKQTHSVFAGLSKILRKPLAKKNENIQKSQNAVTTARGELPRSVIAALTKETLEVHSGSLSAATKDKDVTAKASITSAQVQGKRRAEEQEQEGLLPKKPKITHIVSATPTQQSEKRSSVPARTVPAAPITASAAVKTREGKLQLETKSGSERAEPSSREETATKLNATSAPKAIVAEAEYHSEPVRLAGKKRKSATTEDVETSAEIESKKQRLSRPTQVAKLDNAEPQSLQTSPKVRELPRALHNSANACYINATMHLLHTIPELAEMKGPGNANARYYSPHTEDEEWKIVEKRTTGKGVKKDLKLVRDLLEKPAVKQQLRLRDFLATFLEQMSSASTEPINAFFFHQVCGALLKSDDNKNMNGDAQEDVADFLRAVITKLVSEGESQTISELFGYSLEQKMCCQKCRKERTFTNKSDHFSLAIPAGSRNPGSTVRLKTLVDCALQDQSWASDYVCENCKKICAVEHKRKCSKSCAEPGTLKLKKGWEGSRLARCPPHLIAPIRRTVLAKEQMTEGRGTRKRTWTEMVSKKLRAKVRLDTAPIPMVASDGSIVSYELVAAVEHKGVSANSGHYMTLRKVGDEWTSCDDANFGGVEWISTEQLRRRGLASLCLFKKVPTSRA